MNDCKFYREKSRDCLVLQELVCENKYCTFYKSKNNKRLETKLRKKDILLLPIETKIVTDRGEFIKTNNKHCFIGLDYSVPDLYLNNITNDLKITDNDRAGTKIIKIEKPNYEIFWERDKEIKNMIESNYEHIPRID